MQKKVNITLDPKVDEALFDAQYREMAADETRETEALAWSDGLIGDVADEMR